MLAIKGDTEVATSGAIAGSRSRITVDKRPSHMMSPRSLYPKYTLMVYPKYVIWDTEPDLIRSIDRPLIRSSSVPHHACATPSQGTAREGSSEWGESRAYLEGEECRRDHHSGGAAVGCSRPRIRSLHQRNRVLWVSRGFTPPPLLLLYCLFVRARQGSPF
jgi:hypothetical protein